MAILVGLLRAVNVGGTGKLPMAELRSLCEQAGFVGPRTYIQSGNVVFETKLASTRARAKLEKLLAEHMGKPVRVMVRTRAELDQVLARNPFPDVDPKRVLVLFLPNRPKRDPLAGSSIPGREKLELAGRELFIHFPDGMGRSKLKIPLADEGTGRNLNTVTKLAAMAAEMEQG